MTISLAILFLTLFMGSCGEKNSSGTFVSALQRDTCDSPDANINCSFIYMPAKLNYHMTLADSKEPGERLIIKGTIFKEDGKTPYPGVVLYAYQTDNKGYYSKKGKERGVQKWHGHLHGWCKTDERGRYEISSVRPAPYPGNTAPAHIHLVVREPHNGKSYYISDIVFKDDKLVTARYLSSGSSMKGGPGVVDLKKSEEGIWKGERNITLKP